MNARPLPDAPLIGFYGDDFTGSTDALEILALAGLDPILITDPEDAGAVEQTHGSRAVGIAGVSRSKSPEWMRRHLPAHFRFLKSLGVAICHYKVCSTFDSSPSIGNIGCALEIGREIYGEQTVPVIVGVPDLGRFQIFGTLFARAGHQVFRIDRHPTMRVHPVTPMGEADLRVHLGEQTELSIGLVDLVQMASGDAERTFARRVAEGSDVVFLDVADDASSAKAGKLIWNALPRPAFVAGSSGVEAALIRHWQATGLLAEDAAGGRADPVEKVVVVSGSCSPATAAQIERAVRHGFAGIRLDTRRILADDAEAYLDVVAREVVAAGAVGQSVVAYTATGPDDPHLKVFADALRSRGWSQEEGNEALGNALADILRRVLPRSDCRRVVVAGGDTSGRIVSALGVTALRMRAPLVRGAPLCLATARNAWADGLELALKGGQVGGPDFFEVARAGGSLSASAGMERIA